jgi:hypothetical protein
VYTRRDFLQRAALLGVAVPALPSLLAACAERDAEDGVELALGTPANPVQQPLFEDNPAIESGLPDEEGPLQLYNWADYINQDAVVAAQDALGVKIEITTFFNEEEAIQKLSSGEVQFDVWFPTSQVVPKSVAGQLLQPLNLDYIPNLEQYVWPSLANPYYDQGARYTVPYVRPRARGHRQRRRVLGLATHRQRSARHRPVRARARPRRFRGPQSDHPALLSHPGICRVGEGRLRGMGGSRSRLG